MKKILLIPAFLFVFCISAHAETLTLSTYYPAPFGSYNRLRLAPSPAPICDANSTGVMYYDSNEGAVLVCVGSIWETMGGIWLKRGDDVFLKGAATNPNLFVGIGTNAPSERLTVVGNIDVSGKSRLLDNVGIGRVPSLTAGTNLDVNSNAYIRGNLGVGAEPSSTADTNLYVQSNAHVNGNVGIGRAPSGTAGTDLDVNSDAYIRGNLGVGAAPHASYALDVTGGDTRITGNVGINKVPENLFPLDVNGQARVIGSFYVQRTAGLVGPFEVQVANTPGNGNTTVYGRLGVGVSPANAQEKVHITGDGGNLLLQGGRIRFQDGAAATRGTMDVTRRTADGKYYPYAVYAP